MCNFVSYCKLNGDTGLVFLFEICLKLEENLKNEPQKQITE